MIDVETVLSRELIRYVLGDSSLGRILVAQSKVGVCAIFLGDSDEALIRELRAAFPGAAFELAPELTNLVIRISHLIESPGERVDFELDMRGSPFERLVWRTLETIEPGATTTYGEIARELGNPRASREVAEACAANTLAVAVPCHRVIKKDGSISGYRWGFKRKRALLKREAELYPHKDPI